MLAGDIYYFDAIRIIFKWDPASIAKAVDLNKLKQYCDSATLTTMSGNIALTTGYRSRLDLKAPQAQALQLLEKSISNLDHTISYVELTKDSFVPDEVTAVSKVYKLIEITRKFRDPHCSIYDSNRFSDEQVFPKPGFLSVKTGYHGKESFQYVTYARYSKVAKGNSPCVHTEFRIKPTKKVKKYLGIESIADLTHYDLQANFEKLKKKYIRYEEIDHQKHGKFLLGRTGMGHYENLKKKTLSKFPIIAENLGPRMASHRRMRAEQIETAGELRSYYNKLQREVRKKKKMGTSLTGYEANKIATLDDIKLNKFFKSVPTPD